METDRYNFVSVVDGADYDKLRNSLYITISGKDNRITVWRDIVRILGFPKFICVRVNTERTSILLKPCDEKDVMAFRVPDDLFTAPNGKFRIASKDFVRDILVENGYDSSISYSFKGYYSAKINSVIIPLENAVHSPWYKD